MNSAEFSRHLKITQTKESVTFALKKLKRSANGPYFFPIKYCCGRSCTMTWGYIRQALSDCLRLSLSCLQYSSFSSNRTYPPHHPFQTCPSTLLAVVSYLSQVTGPRFSVICMGFCTWTKTNKFSLQKAKHKHQYQLAFFTGRAKVCNLDACCKDSQK